MDLCRLRVPCCTHHGRQVYIWDLKDPSKPYSPTPGQKSSKLDEITSVAWNQQVQYVLAGASSTGYTVVWDLRGKREVVALAYGGGAGTLAGLAGAGTGMAVGGRRGMSDIAWHPDNVNDFHLLIIFWHLNLTLGDEARDGFRRRLFAYYYGLGFA